jgi:hypothetical protein
VRFRKAVAKLITISVWKAGFYLFAAVVGTLIGAALAMRSLFKAQSRLDAVRKGSVKMQAYRRVPPPPRPNDSLDPYR